jgi:hypothetical protein
MDTDNTLRIELNRIARVPVERHEDFVEELRQRWPHSISMVDRARPYTCFQYAFSLHDPPAVVRTIGIVHKDIYPSPEFVEYLVAHTLTPVLGEASGIGDVVLYRDGRDPRHAGILHGRGVRSKWGIGHLWDHALLEVPGSYGDAVDYFRPISVAAAVAAFLGYARGKLGQAAFDEVVGRRRPSIEV